MPITLPTLYCAELDEDLTTTSDNFVYWFNFGSTNPVVYQQVMVGKGGGLDQLTDTARLYIMAHGHTVLPIFCLEKSPTTWTAGQMAAMLRMDGLPTTHVTFELLVCYAGLSTVTADRLAQVTRLQQAYKATVAAAGQRPLNAAQQRLVDRAAAAYKAAIDSSVPPTDFASPRQVQPLVCQLVTELKRLGFNTLRVTAYKAEVSTSFSAGTGGGQIKLTLPGYQFPEPATNHPDLIVTWT